VRLEVVILRAAGGEAREMFAKRLSADRPQALFVSPITGLMRRGDVVVKATGLVCRSALSLASGAVVSLDEMADWEFVGRVDGGPEGAREIIRFAMIEARAALAALGYATSSEYGRGFSARALPAAEE
jgi:hypothetical protein